MKRLLVVAVSLAVLIASASSAAAGDLENKLIHAAAIGQVDSVRTLLDRGANVNARDNKGETALMWADSADIARLLLDKGVDVNAKDNNGETSLIGAAVTGKADIARLLLDRGADVNAKDNDGYTALYWANRGRAEDVAHAASPSVAKVPDGFLGIHWGANREQIIKAMHERGFTTKGTFLRPRKTPPPTLVFRGNFGGVNCQLEFYLEHNLFYAGVATYLGMFDTQPVQERIYKEMVSRIGQKYGPPQSDKMHDLKANDGKILRFGDANWEFDDHASSEKYQIAIHLLPDGFEYFSHWNRTFGFVKIFYTDVSLEKRLQNQDF